MSYLDRTSAHVNAFGTVDIREAKSVEEALALANLDWEVEKRQIFDADGKVIPKYVTTNRSDTGEMLGMVTTQYEPVQNRAAFDFIDALPEEGGFEFESAGVMNGGKGVWLMGQLPKENILGDDVTNNIVFTNSHDGSSGVRVLMTPTRVICSNMLNLALRRAQRKWAARHSKLIDFRMAEAKETLGLANHYMSELSDEAERLADQKIDIVTLEKIFDEMFPVDEKTSERRVRNISVMKDNYFKCYSEDDLKQFVGTAWGAINAFADLFQHSAPTRISDTYYDNKWVSTIQGDANFDKAYKMIKAL